MDRFQVTPTVTGFEFTRDGAARTILKLKTPAGDVRGPWWSGPSLESVEQVVIALVPPDAPPGFLQPGALTDHGIAVFAPELRDPGHVLECLHDGLAALAFLAGFGVDQVALAGAGVPGGAACAAAFGSPLVRALALLDPAALPATLPDRNAPPVAAWTSSGAPLPAPLDGLPQVRHHPAPPAPGEVPAWLVAALAAASA